MEFFSLKELSVVGEENRRIKVKVSRKWEEINPLDRQVQGLNVIFVDPYHNRIHCWIEKNMLNKIGKLLMHGKMYYIHNFNVTPYTRSNRCFKMDNHVILLNETVVTEVNDPYNIIPPDVYFFANIKNIPQIGHENSSLIDVVGMIKSVKQAENITTENLIGRTFFDFKITDLVHDARVRFWDDFGSNFHYQLSQATVLPAIIIIGCVKVKRNEYSGVCTLTNVPATEIYINPNSEKVDSLRRRFWEVNGI